MKNNGATKGFNNKKTILISVILVITLISTGMAFVYLQLSRVNTNNISKDDKDLGIVETAKEKAAEKEEVINIALFGIDTGRAKYEAAHSDAIMVATIDTKHKKLKITSILRDSYVEVEGYGKTKITHAYTFGGPELAIKTLNQNFNLDIRDYVTINFDGLASIIDSLGGVELDVKQSEISEINKYASEVAKIRKKKHVAIKKPGLQPLNGNQATAYARIRAVGNGDFERTSRQQEVIGAIAERINEKGTSSYIQVATGLLPYVETSMSSGDMIGKLSQIIASGITEIDSMRFPRDSSYKGQIINKVWYLTYDIAAAGEELRRFIYDDIKPETLQAGK